MVRTDPCPPPANRLCELDALRGLAALAVVFYHYSYFIQFMVPGATLPALQVRWGDDGVKLFFAISAFAMLATLDRTPTLLAFARARARRLLPEYWLAMALTGIVAWLFGPARLAVSPMEWLANLPLMQKLTGVPMVDGVYWTLNVEVIFYTLIALAWRIGALRSIDRLVLAWLAVRLVCWLLPTPAWVQFVLLTDHAAWFSVGLIAYPVWRGTARWQDQRLLAAAILGVQAFTAGLHATLLVVGMMALFFGIAMGRVRGLRHPLLLWLGGISYPLYLVHAGIGYAIIARLQAAGINADIAQLAALAAMMLLAMAVGQAGDAWRDRRSATPHLRRAPT
ncbi:acyltransferase [uncultured Sphingomonas sp.]|uniref:acyltransferase family protein n=1 Tax=uncultured Sphingomonas sp. TaxID=158754 RepID=UPI0025E9EF37|nr:acyltransferase [uncultured Sphingomonas sp.]